MIHHGGVVNIGIVRTNEATTFEIRAHNTNPNAAYIIGQPISPFSLAQGSCCLSLSIPLIIYYLSEIRVIHSCFRLAIPQGSLRSDTDFAIVLSCYPTSAGPVVGEVHLPHDVGDGFES